MLFAGYHQITFIVDIITTIGKDGYIGLKKSVIQFIAYYINTIRNLAIKSGRWDAINNVFFIIVLAFFSIVFQKKRKEPLGKNMLRQLKKVK